MKRVQVRLPDELRDELDHMVEVDHELETRSQAIRAACRQFAEEREYRDAT